MGLLDGQRAARDRRRARASGARRAGAWPPRARRSQCVDLDGDAAATVAAEIDGIAFTRRRDRLRRARGVPSRTRRRSSAGSRRSTTTPVASNMAAIHDWDLGGVGPHRAPQPHRRLPRHEGRRARSSSSPAAARSSSTASISGTRPAAGEAPYAAAKAAVVALTATAALEYGPTIRVNAVSPGMIHTGLTDILLTGFDWTVPHMEAKTPLGAHRAPRGHRRRRGLPVLGPRPLRDGPEPRRRRRHDAARLRASTACYDRFSSYLT